MTEICMEFSSNVRFAIRHAFNVHEPWRIVLCLYLLAEAHGHKTQLQEAITADEVIASAVTHRSRKNRIPALAHSQEQCLIQE